MSINRSKHLSAWPSTSTGGMLFGFTNKVWSGIQSVAPKPLPAITMLPTAPRFPGNHCKMKLFGLRKLRNTFSYLHGRCNKDSATKTQSQASATSCRYDTGPETKFQGKVGKGPSTTTKCHKTKGFLKIPRTLFITCKKLPLRAMLASDQSCWPRYRQAFLKGLRQVTGPWRHTQSLHK